MSAAKAPKHVFLIDGSGFIFRAYYALPPMTRLDGTPVNAVFGFTKMLMKLIDDTVADHIAVIFDHARKTFRNDIYTDYKANREAPPEDLIPQFALVREATAALNVSAVEKEGFEADDLIATYTRQATEAGAEVTIVSSDKDLMQLVGDRVTMFDAMKNRVIGAAEVMEKFGVSPDKVSSYGTEWAGIEHVSPICARSVMLDLPKFKGVEHLGLGEVVTAEDMEACAAAQGVEVQRGHVLVGHHRHASPFQQRCDLLARAGKAAMAHGGLERGERRHGGQPFAAVVHSLSSSADCS